MLICEKFILQGNALFQKRGMFLSLLAVPVVVLAFQHYQYPLDSPGFKLAWEVLCFTVSLFGLVVRAYTVGCTPKRTSGRNTRKGQVADQLNTTGMYSLMRNPLYFGNFLVGLGPAMLFFIWWLPVIYTLVFWLFYERVVFAEEAFLQEKFGQEYFHWIEKTPVFFPALRKWQPSQLPFSWRAALKGEYQTASLIVAMFTVFQIICHVRLERQLSIEAAWLGLFGLAAVFFLVVRFLRKHTAFLSLPPR